MSVTVAAGVILILAGPAAHHRAFVLLLDRWRTLSPRDWSETMRPVRRVVPFGLVLRSQIFRERAGLWRWSTPAWAVGDVVAQRLLKQIRLSPLISVVGFVFIVAGAIMS
jgi:hypothetical protein